MSTLSGAPWHSFDLRKRLRAFLIRYTNAREKAYEATRVQSMKRLAPINRIRRQLEHYQNSSLLQHYQLVVNLESDLRAILPPEGSRFRKQRLQVLETLDYCKQKLKI